MKETKNNIALVEKKGTVKWNAQDKRRYNCLQKSIAKEYMSVEKSSLNIAFFLHEVYRDKYYEIDGYRNIYDFASDKFNIARGTCNNFINIVERFGKKDILDNYVGELKDEFKDFTFSKLIILLGVDDKKISLFNPNMTVKEIKAKREESERMDSLDSVSEDMSEDAAEIQSIETVFDDSSCSVIVFESIESFEENCTLDKELFEVLSDSFKDFKKKSGQIPRIEICLHVE